MIEAIIDSGSTKADWRILLPDSVVAFSTIGFNPYFISSDEIIAAINQQVPAQINGLKINRIHFYGAGCGAEIRRNQVAFALKQCFPDAAIQVDTDLLAAARALLKNESGFAAILGTGTNSGMYDGKQITHSIDSLGYFLGDEGSGASIGRKLLRDFLRGYFPVDLENQFSIVCKMNREQILEQLYSKPFPNRFLAGWVPFVAEHQSHPFMQSLLKECFNEFFAHIITHYENFRQYSFNCSGSVGFVFSECLRENAELVGIRVGKIIQSPVDELIIYHQANL